MEAFEMARRLKRAGVRNAREARALSVPARDLVLGVSAWGGSEDAAWRDALIIIGLDELTADVLAS
jgi:hypothetical protein